MGKHSRVWTPAQVHFCWRQQSRQILATSKLGRRVRLVSSGDFRFVLPNKNIFRFNYSRFVFESKNICEFCAGCSKLVRRLSPNERGAFWERTKTRKRENLRFAKRSFQGRSSGGFPSRLSSQHRPGRRRSHPPSAGDERGLWRRARWFWRPVALRKYNNDEQLTKRGQFEDGHWLKPGQCLIWRLAIVVWPLFGRIFTVEKAEAEMAAMDEPLLSQQCTTFSVQTTPPPVLAHCIWNLSLW